MSNNKLRPETAVYALTIKEATVIIPSEDFGEEQTQSIRIRAISRIAILSVNRIINWRSGRCMGLCRHLNGWLQNLFFKNNDYKFNLGDYN